MAAVSPGLALLEAAVGYALSGADRVTPPLLSRPTPCPAWDLARLLEHLSDSLGVLEFAGLRQTVTGEPSGSRDRDPVARLRERAAALLRTWATDGPPEHAVTFGDRELTANMVAVTGAIEIAVHGWDIAVTCGDGRPIPPGLAALLLPVAPLLVPREVRPGLFADPVSVPAAAGPGDQLIAFLGRNPATSERPAGRYS